MIIIRQTARYRDGGTPSVLFTVQGDSLESFGLSDIPTQKTFPPDNRPMYEVWRDIRSGKYFYGDINGENAELDGGHRLVKTIFDLLDKERAAQDALFNIFKNGK